MFILIVVFDTPISGKEIDSFKAMGFYETCQVLGLHTVLFKTLNTPKFIHTKLSKKYKVSVFEIQDANRWESSFKTKEIQQWVNDALDGPYLGSASVNG